MEENNTGIIVGWSVGIVVFLMIIGLVGCPTYHVYQQGMEGQAKLKEAESSRQIAILEAKALEESAKYKAQAEIERAKGVAEANRIIGESLKNNEGYLRYLWITGLESGEGKETIYVPTEAGLPILESSRLMKSKGAH